MPFLRRLLGLPGEEFSTRAASSAAPVPPARSAARVVSMESALGLTGIFRGMQILATSVGQLQVVTKRGTREIPSGPLVTKPDVDRSRRSHFKRTTVSLAGTGNAFWRVYRDPSGRASTVRNLDPLRVHVGRDLQGRRVFEYSDPWTGRRELLSPVRDNGRSGDLMHLRLLEVPGLELGLGPIQACRAAVAGGLDLADFSDNWFSAGDIPTGILSTTQQLTQDDADRYRDRWEKTQAGKRGVAVLGAGLAYEPVLLKPADAQFLESRAFSITDQARMMGIPAPLLLAAVDGSAMTYQNMEHVDLQLMKHTVMDYLNVIEDALSELLPIGQTAEFQPFGSLRSDNKTRAEVNKLYVDMGAKSLEQVAREESFELPPASSRSSSSSSSSTPAGADQDQDQETNA